MKVTTRQTMQISERINRLKPSATLGVTAKVRALETRGVNVVDFGAGEPDFDTPEHIREAAVEALRAGMTHYMPVPGEPRARAAIAEKLREENGVECTADHVVISTGGKQSVYLAIHCLVDPGREVVLPTPAWVSYQPIIELAGGVTVEVPGPIENDFKITPAQLEDAITPQTCAVVLNSPSNPCGTMYTPQEVRALGEVIARHEQVTLISDEIYEKLIFGGIEHFSPGSIPEIAGRVVTVGGLSKAYAMTGWRIGYAAAPGNNGAVAKAMAKLQGQMTSNITSFCYPAIVEALEHGADDVEQMRRAFAERAKVVHKLIRAMPGVRCARPTGAFYVFPDVSAHFGKRSARGAAIGGSQAFAEALLEEAHVAVVPGADFGECAAGHVRISFATSIETIQEGCRRMDGWLRTLS